MILGVNFFRCISPPYRHSPPFRQPDRILLVQKTVINQGFGNTAWSLCSSDTREARGSISTYVMRKKISKQRRRSFCFDLRG